MKKSAPRPDAATTIELYRSMLRIRLAEQRITEVYPTDKIQSPIHLSVGQEAIAAGVCAALLKTDHVHGTYRGHAFYLAKGGDMNRMFAELYGKDAGCARGKGGSMHLVDPEAGLMSCSAIVASTIPVATGDAFASSRQGRKRVVVSVFGDGAIDEGVFFESVNFAVLKKLPILYVLENNGYAIHSKIPERRKQVELWRAAEGLGLPGEKFDGNDVGAVYSVMAKAVAWVRKGGGPRLLEFTAYRWHEHVGPGIDFHEGYRRPNEQALAQKNDPLRLAKADLAKRCKVGPEHFEQWEAEARDEVDEAVEFAERSPFPTAERLHQDVFAERS
ncbi:MAG: thiamine pyrophosphate-dependent dehydrogenase E1 component subunit alpha [Elusimicrobia bacterium]|nr:thiamine pyrophosphate-dependent dehydrogenase E1 component subunit alpha [Elusimicrobiota bacterium]